MQALPALLQLASPALPIGAFSYSSGLESAIELKWVNTAEHAHTWINTQLRDTVLSWELPLWAELFAAWRAPSDEVTRLNRLAIATRETAELRSEQTQMGHALRRWCLTVLDELSETQKNCLNTLEPLSVLTGHALAAVSLNLDPEQGAMAYAFGFVENQVMAASKALPLGQTAAQRMLRALTKDLGPQVAKALHTPSQQRSSIAPMVAIAAMRHETQYTRIFRS